MIVDDAMIITEKGKQHIFRPLANIEWDFNNFELITIKSLEQLYQYLKIHK